MPQRSLKSMFVEVVSFLTLFALLGTMTSNFWERYLIQNELCNMKSSLHILREAVHHIGAAYDNLHHGLVEIKEETSAKSVIPQDFLKHARKNNETHLSFSEILLQELMKLKTSSKGIITSRGTETCEIAKDKIVASALCNGTTAEKPCMENENIKPRNIESRSKVHKHYFDGDCCQYHYNYNRKF